MSRMLEIPNLDDLIRDYESGMSLKKISDKSGIGRGVLFSRFEHNGVHMRGRSEAETLKWSRVKKSRTLVERQCSAAWDSVRGRKKSMSWRLKQAKAIKRPVGRFEEAIANAVERCGIACERQFPLGIYNLDLALTGESVAVEIACSNHRRSLHRKRIEYIFNRGFDLLIVHRPVNSRVPINAPIVTEQIVRFCEATSSLPATCSQYGVIGCNGEPFATRCYDFNGYTRVEGF